MDHVHTAIRALLASQSVLGRPGRVLLDEILTPPIQRRRNEILEDVANTLLDYVQKVEHLERRVGQLDSRMRSELFVSVAIQATVAAAKTHEPEKRQALRNAILNTAVSQTPDEIRALMFVAWLDQFTEWHIRVLRVLAEPEGFLNREGPSVSISRAEQVLERAFPQLPRAITEHIVRDLAARELTTLGTIADPIFPKGEGALSELGNEFLAFITEPTF